jgi:hypothetical protein
MGFNLLALSDSMSVTTDAPVTTDANDAVVMRTAVIGAGPLPAAAVPLISRPVPGLHKEQLRNRTG